MICQQSTEKWHDVQSGHTSSQALMALPYSSVHSTAFCTVQYCIAYVLSPEGYLYCTVTVAISHDRNLSLNRASKSRHAAGPPKRCLYLDTVLYTAVFSAEGVRDPRAATRGKGMARRAKIWRMASVPMYDLAPWQTRNKR